MTSLPEDGVLLRVFLGETDRYEGRPLYEQIVRKARELNLAGATVVRGIMGYGARSLIHTAKVLRLSEDLPVVVEIVDTREKVEELLPFLDETVEEGLVTLERAEVMFYRHGEASEAPGEGENA